MAFFKEAEIPARTARGASSEYADLLTEFQKASIKSALVTLDKKPSTIYQSLTKTLKTHPEFAGISVVRRGDSVYLSK